MTEKPVGCARPTGARVGEQLPESTQTQAVQNLEIKTMSIAKVGSKAPDFEAPAYYQGKFGSVKLSDFAGKWVLFCLYPGDFTFV
jgi:hypothetical protein